MMKSKVKSAKVASNSKEPAVTMTPPQSLLKEDNPMKIDLILRVLFDFCPSKTLANCRLVCKQWRDVSLKAWRNKATLCLSKAWRHTTVEQLLLFHNSNKERKSLFSNRRIYEDDKPLQLKKYPFKNFQIDESSLIELKLKDSKLINDVAHSVILHNFELCYTFLYEFLSNLHSLEYLELRNCWDYYSRHRPDLLRDEGDEPFILKNMKRIKVCVQKPTLRFRVPREGFLRLFPNLQVLCLEYRMNESSMETMKKILSEVSEMNLKELEIINLPPTHESHSWRQHFKMNLLDTIAQCDFPLERLELDLAFTSKKLNRLLESCRESLKYLRTSFYFDMDIFIDHHTKDDSQMRLKKAMMPDKSINISMDTLKEVKVANGLWGLYLLAHLNLPNLEKLKVEYGKHERKVNILEYQVQLLKAKIFPKLETFELLDNHDIVGPETMTVLSNMMPHLQALTCPLDKQAFRNVCRRFKNLKTLNVLGVQGYRAVLDDETLTGVHEEGGPGTRPPNITDLASLTDLSISRDAAVFNDNSVMHGFLQLPRLYFLSVAFKKISDEMKAKLLSHVKGTVLIQNEDCLNLVASESDDDFIGTEETSSSDDESVSLEHEEPPVLVENPL